LLDTDIARRIWVTRYLMVIGIVVLHVPPYESLGELGLSAFDLIKAFFSHAVFRTTVPVLTALSGYLLFRSALYEKPLLLLKKKTKSVLVPLVLWNVPVVLAIFLVQKHQLVDHAFSARLYPFELMPWVNALTGLFEAPANYPLNFLRDLFVLSLLSPLLWPLLKYIPYSGLMLLSAVYFYDLDGDLVLRNSMIISFYTGALAAARRWNLTALDRFAWPLLTLFLLCCLAIVLFDIQNREFLRLLAPFLVWPALSPLMRTRAADILYRHSQSSFLTFLAHGPLLLACWLVFSRLPVQLPESLFWFVAPVIVVVSCALVAPLSRLGMPRVMYVLLGGR